jgi:hypothetical protein
VGSATSDSGLRMAELVGTLSLSAALGLGQPLEHVTRFCLLAGRLGGFLGLDAAERKAIYYSALLTWWAAPPIHMRSRPCSATTWR